MKRSAFITFFTIVLTAYGLINFYIWLRGWEALASAKEYRWGYTVVFILWAGSWILGRYLERRKAITVGEALVRIGSFYLAAMVYFLLAALAIDLLRGLNFFFHFFPASIENDPGGAGLLVMLAVIGIVLAVVIGGHINARIPRIRKIELDIPKRAGTLQSISIAVASDIHLGTIICHSRLVTIVEKMNTLNADVALLPGDVIDEDLAPVIRQNLGETLRKIRAKYGVFAITGNHEYIGGVQPAVEYLSKHGIVELRDNAVKIADALYVAGREDLSSLRFAGQKRKPLEEILRGMDKSLPIILMDHQPFHLEQAEQNGVDVQLSGHTHHGQIWPFNFITKKVYELSWGYKQRGNTHYYVSCGVGTWGPPVRTGNTPEIINLVLHFDGESGRDEVRG